MNPQLLIKKQKAIQDYQQGNLSLAAKQIRQVCKKEKNDPESWFLLGIINYEIDNYSSAEKAFLHVIRLGKNNEFALDATTNLGVIYLEQKKHQQCIDILETIVSPTLNNSSVYINLSIAYVEVRNYSKAKQYALKAVDLSPGEARAHLAYASVCEIIKDYDLAEKSFIQAINIDPDNISYLSDYATSLVNVQEYSRSIKVCDTVLGYQPGYADAWGTKLQCALEAGDQKNGLIEYQKLIERNRIDPIEFPGFLFCLFYDNVIKFKDIQKYHRMWGEACSSCYSIKNSKFRSSKNKLKIGYISPDFRKHSVAYFIENILVSHNHEEMIIYCFSSVASPDETTKRLKKFSDHWIDVSKLDDEQMSAAILSSKIDVLVDLAGLTHGSRINAFAQRLAPVQVTYLGYPSTTGLPEMDYRLVDKQTDPEGFDQYCTEELIRIPDCFLCYRGEGEPIVDKNSDMPITFVSFNNLAKVNEAVISLWAKVLHEVQNSIIIIKSKPLASAMVRERYLAMFSEYGVGIERIEFYDKIEDPDEHLRLYGRCDVALDTFPYNGTTTSCEAMWMGVPVVTLRGDQHVSRVTSSILTAIGCEDWIADSEQEYIEIARKLVSDREILGSVRNGLRGKMQQSVLCDGPGFTAKLEVIYRDLYKRKMG